jgi:hypothetical protein
MTKHTREFGNGGRASSVYVGPEYDEQTKDDVSVSHLLRQLSREVTDLFSKEAALARAELRESVHDAKVGLVGMTTGGIVLLAGIIVLCMAAVYGIATVMEIWLAALIVGGAVTVIGLIMFAGGKSKLSSENLRPQHTLGAVKEDRNALKGVAR